MCQVAHLSLQLSLSHTCKALNWSMTKRGHLYGARHAAILVQLGHKVQSVFEEAEFYKRLYHYNSTSVTASFPPSAAMIAVSGQDCTVL